MKIAAVDSLTPYLMNEATSIWAVDAEGVEILQLWGQEIDRSKALEIVIDRNSSDQLLELAEMVRSSKGSLRPGAEALLRPPDSTM